MILSSLSRMRIEPRRLFPRRGMSQPSLRAGWRPMHLLWARRRQQVSPARPLSGRGTIAANYSSALHLHFAMLHAATSSMHRTSIEGASTTKVVRQQQRDGGRTMPMQMLMGTAPSALKEHRHLFSRLHQVMLQRQHRLVHTATEQRHTYRNIPSARTALVEPAPFRFGSKSHRIATPVADAVNSRRFREETRLSALVHRRHLPASTPSSFKAADTHYAATTAAPHRRAPDLVWRRVEGEERASSVAESPVRGLAIPSATAVSAGWQMQSAPVQSQPRIDASMIDRIAEDVIGKVERRMRVERERRGL